MRGAELGPVIEEDNLVSDSHGHLCGQHLIETDLDVVHISGGAMLTSPNKQGQCQEHDDSVHGSPLSRTVPESKEPF